jgi:hypothetical protein
LLLAYIAGLAVITGFTIAVVKYPGLAVVVEALKACLLRNRFWRSSYIVIRFNSVSRDPRSVARSLYIESSLRVEAIPL